MKIYVGNLPFSMDNDALMELFKQHGEVNEARPKKRGGGRRSGTSPGP
jgi:RNA recognition motif-containing protein